MIFLHPRSKSPFVILYKLLIHHVFSPTLSLHFLPTTLLAVSGSSPTTPLIKISLYCLYNFRSGFSIPKETNGAYNKRRDIGSGELGPHESRMIGWRGLSQSLLFLPVILQYKRRRLDKSPRLCLITAIVSSFGHRKVPSSIIQHCSKLSVLAQSLGIK